MLRTARSSWPLLLVVLAVTGAGCRGCDGSVNPSAALVSVEPEQLNFGWVVLGEQAIAAARVRNEGRSRVDIRLVVEGAAFSVKPEELSLPIGEEKEVTVTFRPTTAGTHAGRLEVRTGAVLATVELLGEAHPCPAPVGCVGQRFDAESGRCVEEVLADGAACNTTCIPSGTCAEGVCEGDLRECDDENLCTRDACDEGTGCTHTDESAECPAVTEECRVAACDALTGCGSAPAADGTTCGSGCLAGSCQGGTCVPDPSGCDDENACTRDVCDADAGTCSHEDVSLECPASSNNCETSVCEPAVGCTFAAVEDGFPCGEATCAVLPQCEQGQCIDKPAPAPGPCGCSTALAPPRRLDVAGDHSCRVTPASTVECWGMNTGGEVDGIGGAHRNTPVPVSGISDAVGVGVGGLSSFAFTADGGVYFWGRLFGQLTTSPSLMPGFQNGVAAGGGGWTDCLLTADGSVWCYGLNAFGEFGDGTTNPRTSWAAVPNLGSAVGFSASGMVCAILEDRSVRCWGPNGAGSMGIGGDGGSSMQLVLTPTPARLHDGGFVHGVVEVAGGYPSCVRTMNHEVLCAGDMDFLRNGANGTVFPNTTYFAPLPVAGCPIQISTAGSSGFPYASESKGVLCVLVDGGIVQCTGDNEYGALGTGDTLQPDGGWSNASGLTGVTEIRTALEYTCANFEDGGFRCWGSQGSTSGYLGDGTDDPYRYSP